MRLDQLLHTDPVHDVELGLYDIPDDVYHNITRRPDIVRSSGLKHALGGPAHYEAYFQAPSWQPTPAARLGTAVHAWLLEPEKWESRRVPPKVDQRTKAGKERMAEWCAAHPKGLWVEPEHDELISKMIAAVEDLSVIKLVRTSTKAMREKTIVFREQALTCVARPDFVTEANVIVDVKTTTDPGPDAFSRSIRTWRYDLQACHYTNAVASQLGNVTKFCWLVIGTEPPFEVRFYELDQDSYTGAWAAYQRALDNIKKHRDGYRRLPCSTPLETLKVRL